MEWGPPVYIPVAGYFKLGRASSRRKIPPGTPGEQEVRPFVNEGRGNLEELLSMFGGGVIQ